MENFKPQKILRSSPSLKIRSTPLGPSSLSREVACYHLKSLNGIESEKPKVIRSSKICTIQRDMRTFCFISQELSTLPRNQCLRTGPKWCRKVHAVSTRYATVYIVTPFLPVRLHFLKHELCNITKRWMATELKKRCAQGDPVPTFLPEYKVSTWYSGAGTVQGARILAWVCFKKGCVHISTQRVSYLGIVPGHQV